MAGIDLPSESFDYGEPMALMGAMAVKLPAALDTIDRLINQRVELRTSVKLAITMIAETTATINHYIDDWHLKGNRPSSG